MTVNRVLFLTDPQILLEVNKPFINGTITKIKVKFEKGYINVYSRKKRTAYLTKFPLLAMRVEEVTEMPLIILDTFKKIKTYKLSKKLICKQ